MLKTRSKKSQHPICTHCGIQGDTIDKCYNVHGYPLGYRQRHNGHNSNPNQKTNLNANNAVNVNSTMHIDAQGTFNVEETLAQCHNMLTLLPSKFGVMKNDSTNTSYFIACTCPNVVSSMNT